MNEPQNPPWTPGPWYVDADYPCNVSTADHRTIAETCDSWFNLEISRANARLIAASPRMIDYIQRMANDGDNEAKDIVAEVTNASAK